MHPASRRIIDISIRFRSQSLTYAVSISFLNKFKVMESQGSHNLPPQSLLIGDPNQGLRFLCEKCNKYFAPRTWRRHQKECHLWDEEDENNPIIKSKQPKVTSITDPTTHDDPAIEISRNSPRIQVCCLHYNNLYYNNYILNILLLLLRTYLYT